MTQKLTIVSYGFFLYAVEDQECSVFAAPALKSGDTKHEITAMVIGPITCSTVPGIKASHDVISPATCTLRFGGKAGAALSDFHLIVNFGALCCGARLKKNWTTDDPKHTDLQVELSRGTLTAYPDAYTNAARWKWQDCNGAHVEQRVTSLTVYEQDSWPGVLEFEARREGGTAGTVEFNGDAIVVLAHKLADAEALAKRVDDAHADATKRLCCLLYTSDAADE